LIDDSESNATLLVKRTLCSPSELSNQQPPANNPIAFDV
jgi:hypothetical protein